MREFFRYYLRSPTGFGLRSDATGDGAFGAPRRRGPKSYPHNGLDVLAEPEQWVVAPAGGVFVRKAKPYGDGRSHDNGALLRLNRLKGFPVFLRMFYLEPVPWLKANSPIEPFTVIGRALPFERSPGTKPHIHLKVTWKGQVIEPVLSETKIGMRRASDEA